MLCTACPLTGLINIRFGLSCRQRVSWGALWFTKLWNVLPKRSTQKGKWHTGSWMSGNFEENKCMFLRFSGSCFRSKQFSSSSSPEESQQSLLLKRSPPVKGSSSFPLLPKGVHKGSSDCWRFSLLYCDQYSYIWDHKIKQQFGYDKTINDEVVSNVPPRLDVCWEGVRCEDREMRKAAGLHSWEL